VICIDSDVFLIDLRYPADHRARATRAFLETVARSGDAATTVFNVLEVTGVLSFNLSDQQVVDFYAHFPRRYNVRVLPYHDPAQRLPALPLRQVLQTIQRKMAFGDALIATLVNRLHSALEAFVTWNDAHFQGRLAVPIFTPATYPRRERRSGRRQHDPEARD
jgi:predicted nucleic acid-binding protein